MLVGLCVGLVYCQLMFWCGDAAAGQGLRRCHTEAPDGQGSYVLVLSLLAG